MILCSAWMCVSKIHGIHEWGIRRISSRPGYSTFESLTPKLKELSTRRAR